MNVSAIIVTKGNVDLSPCLETLPPDWERVVWNNGTRRVSMFGSEIPLTVALDSDERVTDVSVYGRYAAIAYATWDIIYVQDDDVIVSDPAAIVAEHEPGKVVLNMPSEFRPNYPDSGLVGFGACFERNLPRVAFERFAHHHKSFDRNQFNRECDGIFTVLTDRIWVDVPKTDREFASDPDRLWRQPEHVGLRFKMRDLAREVREAGEWDVRLWHQ